MKTLEEGCRCLTANLEQVEKAIEATAAELARFEKDVACYPVDWVDLRLQTIGLQVALEATQQLLEHGGKGIIYIMTQHDGRIAVTWSKEEYLPNKARESWQARVTMLTQEQFFAFLKQIRQQLNDGDWEPVVRWLQAHGKLVAPLKLI